METIASGFSEKSSAIPSGEICILPPPLPNNLETLMPAGAEPNESSSLADYVRYWMNEYGLTNVEVSAAAKRHKKTIGKSTVDDILQGTTGSSIHKLHALALGLGRPLEEVINAALGEQIIKAGLKRSELANVDATFQQLTNSDQKIFKRFLEMLDREMRRAIKSTENSR